MKDEPAEAAPKPIPSVARDASYLTRSAVGLSGLGHALLRCPPCPDEPTSSAQTLTSEKCQQETRASQQFSCLFDHLVGADKH